MKSNDNNGNIIDMLEYEELREINDFLQIMKLGKVINVINIDDDGVVDLFEFGIHRLGFVIYGNFVTFEKKPKIYRIDLDLDGMGFSQDTEPGIYITKLYDIDIKDKEETDFLIKNIDLARRIIYGYAPLLKNQDNIPYDNNSKQLEKDDKKYIQKQECEIIDFAKGVKAVEAHKRKLNQEYVKNLVKGNKRW